MSIGHTILVDGSLNDWLVSDRIDDGLNANFQIYGTSDNNYFYFALTSPSTIIGANTTVWLNTDRNASTGYQIFGWAGGAEYNVNFNADGTVSLYSGGAGQTLVLAGLTTSWSPDRMTVEFSIPKSAVGNPNAIDTLYDVNDTTFLPSSYSLHPFTLFNDTGITPAADTRIGIVFSQTTAQNYWSQTAYSQLFMSVQEQAMQAGIPFDILTESDLTDLNKLSHYDALVFPSFRNVQSSQVNDIANTLEQATKQFGIGLVVGGEFMTNDQTGAALPGDSYSRMKLLLDATRVTGGNSDNIAINATDPSGLVLDGYANGQLVNSYQGVGWNAFAGVSNPGTTVATETINGGTSYASVLATQTGGRNVLFSTEGVMADANMLQKAISYAAEGTGVSVGLQLTRNTGIVATRMDMDQSQEIFDVKPEGGGPGIYDKLLPILTQWKQAYDFVGSYYLNVGNNPPDQQTNWSVSLPYYKALIDLGGELGTHSYTHPDNTNILSAAQIQFEFQDSKTVLQNQISAYLGSPYVINGAAVPGAPETLTTSQAIMQYVNQYLTGGYAAQGSGYPNAFGYMLPGQDKIYFAPNTVFDFTLIEFQHKTIAEAQAEWAAEYNKIVANADTPIVLWPIHDYGAADWNTNGTGTDSPYDTAMYTQYIANAYNQGMEFVTLGDLASRIAAFKTATLTTSISGNTITATVGASNVGQFALDLDRLGGQVIQNVNGWYAYDSDSVFMPQNGGTFTIHLGAAQDDVTHITQLPMRASLLGVNGDGHNLSFSVQGEGNVVVDLAALGDSTITVSGASIASQAGEILTLNIGSYGVHNVTISYSSNHPPTITSNGGGDTAALSIPENSKAVTTVTATDPDPGTTLVYSISGGADQLKFTINSVTGVLSFITAPNFEAPTDVGANNVYDVIVRASDGSLFDDQAIAVTITNVNEPPVITSNGGGTTANINMKENLTAVTTVIAVDPDVSSGDSVHYSIIGGADSALFTIDPNSGALSFITAPDYEQPADANHNNSYLVTVAAIDSFGLQDTQAITVNIGNVKGINLNGTSGNDILTGTGEEDTINGRGGNDIIYGLGGNDTLNGGDGNDILYGGDGNDILYGGAGADILNGDAGNDILYGEGGNDILNGGDGNDILYGGAGNDTLNGGAGDDILIGGGGLDVLTGGPGADIFRFNNASQSTPSARNIIMDFEQGSDRIDLSGIDANTGIRGNQPFTSLTQTQAAFTGPAQLHYHYETIGGSEYTILEGNVNSTAAPEFSVALLGHYTLQLSDLIL